MITRNKEDVKQSYIRECGLVPHIHSYHRATKIILVALFLCLMVSPANADSYDEYEIIKINTRETSVQQWLKSMCSYWDLVISFYEDDGLYMGKRWSQHNDHALDILGDEDLIERVNKMKAKFYIGNENLKDE